MDNYVYLSVKLYLQDGQTEESIHEVVQEMDYSFDHEQITDHEIVDILDTQFDEEMESIDVGDDDFSVEL